MSGRKSSKKSKSAADSAADASGAPGHAAASDHAADSGDTAASGSNDDDVYKRVFYRVIKKVKARTARGAAPDPHLDEIIRNIDIIQRDINLQADIIESNKKKIKYVSKSEIVIKSEEEKLDRINAAKKNIVVSENHIKYLMSLQEHLEYRVDIGILSETDPQNEEKLKNLKEKLKNLEENIQIQQANHTTGTSMHANTKLNHFKEYSLPILTEFYNDVKRKYNIVIDNLTQIIINLIDKQFIDRQIKESNRASPDKMVDLYMLIASSILDGINDEDIKSNKYIIWLKGINITLEQVRINIETRLKQNAEKYYHEVYGDPMTNPETAARAAAEAAEAAEAAARAAVGDAAGDATGAAVGDATGAASGARQMYPEGGPSEGGGRRKKTRRSRNKRHVTAKYRK